MIYYEILVSVEGPADRNGSHPQVGRSPIDADETFECRRRIPIQAKVERHLDFGIPRQISPDGSVVDRRDNVLGGNGAERYLVTIL